MSSESETEREKLEEANHLRLMADAPILQAYIEKCEEVERLRQGIRSILSDYDITELIRDVPEDEWNFEQQALIRMKELIE
tara:strand:- start:182 stop:424 length:243 start_codon:yes stop_codon:yes gene_type:complete